MKRLHNTTRYIDSSNKHFNGNQKAGKSIIPVSEGSQPDQLQPEQREQVGRPALSNRLNIIKKFEP
jgi:hypothetical protein